MFAAIRLKGNASLKKGLIDTMKMLRIEYPNNCVLLPETDSYKGMLTKCKDICTWGEVDKKTLVKLLEKRLRTEKNGRVDEKLLKELGFDGFEKLADSLIADKTDLRNLKKIKVVFRLTPPSKGFKSLMEGYPKGDLGYRGKKIKELIERMI